MDDQEVDLQIRTQKMWTRKSVSISRVRNGLGSKFPQFQLANAELFGTPKQAIVVQSNPVDPAGPYCYRGGTKTCELNVSQP